MPNYLTFSEALADAKHVSVRKYAAMRSAGWVANAGLWSKYAKADPFRKSSYNGAIRAIMDEFPEHPGRPLTVADFGCGDGVLLERVGKRFPKSRLFGLDNCREFDPVAMNRNEPYEFISTDIEASEVNLPYPLDVVLCVLALIEMHPVDTVIGKIAAALRPGGIAVITVLDPTEELLRYLILKLSESDTTLLKVGNELVVASHFSVNNYRSPKPYYRFIRPLDIYLTVLKTHGMQIEQMRMVGRGSSKMLSLLPRGVLIKARKI